MQATPPPRQCRPHAQAEKQGAQSSSTESPTHKQQQQQQRHSEHTPAHHRPRSAAPRDRLSTGIIAMQASCGQQRQCAGASSCRAAPALHLRRIAAPRPVVATRGLGNEVVGGFLDLTKLVSSAGGAKTPYDELASQIGRDVYADLSGWHLYLRDMSAAPGLKMNVALAQQFGPKAGRSVREADVAATLKQVPVKLGAGKTQVSLFDLLPSMCVQDLTILLQNYEERRR